MEDYEAHEEEFFAKLEESEFSRASMLRRSAAAAFGLTILGAQPVARVGGTQGCRGPAAAGAPRPNMAALVAAAKKEGHLNVIALPPDWANYGEIISTFTKKYGIGITSDNPDGSSAAGEPGDRLAQGRPACSRRRRRQRHVRGRRHRARACTPGTSPATTATDPAGDEGHPRLLDGRLLGRGLDRLQRRPRQQRRRRRSRTC